MRVPQVDENPLRLLRAVRGLVLVALPDEERCAPPPVQPACGART
jgi:hypothetical protein